MSIPPLVCSTPPPLEQVECEDVVHDDFGISYNLSQEDDDFGAYNDFHLAVPTSPYHSPTTPEQEVIPTLEKSSDSRQDKKSPHKFSTNQNITAVDEDNNVEDLDLNFELRKKISLSESENFELNPSPDSEESINRCDSSETDECHSVEVLKDNIENRLKKIEDVNAELDLSNLEQYPPSENVTDPKAKEESQPSPHFSLQKDDDFNSFNFVTAKINLEKEVLGDLTFHQPLAGIQDIDETGEQDKFDGSDIVLDCTENSRTFPDIRTFESEQIVENGDDDFNNFGTFLNDNTKTDSYQTMFAGDTDPWSSGAAVSDDFGDFQATFDNISHQENVEERLKNLTVDGENPSDQDDDFGDFDDFQSSQKLGHTEAEIPRRESDVSMHLKLMDNESQLVESIEKSVHSLFEDKLPNDESRVESNLETSLCVTWGHLTETEIRQPYMLNWNNSIGQKCLLKSLCIDSRNILFGPKWGNMPRYAATLASTPLQPMKQLPGAQNTDPSKPDADRSKRADGWSEAGGAHESCSDSSTPNQPMPDTASSSYQDEILQPIQQFTPPLQPVRQISLPDTHIFTPTDSQVPRSTTIHHDISSLRTPELSARSDISASQNSAHADDDFDDFEDFQHVRNTSQNSSKPVESAIENVTRAPIEENVKYEARILEPIKLEPTVPTLNWPEPGEVKDTFDDFSGFVSNSSWSNVNQSSNEAEAVVDSDDVKHSASNNKITDSKEIKEASEVIDDEFDNFKAAAIKPAENKWDPISSLDPFGNLSPKQVASQQTLSPQNFLHQRLPQKLVMPINGVLPHMAFSQSTVLPQTSFSQSAMPGPCSLPPSTFQPTNVDKIYSLERKEQILQPLSLESISQINWPSPGIDLQDLSRFSPINAVKSLHNSPIKSSADSQEDGWGDFVSIKPSKSIPTSKSVPRVEDDWSDFVSSSTSKQQNGVNTISFNVHTKPAGR